MNPNQILQRSIRITGGAIFLTARLGQRGVSQAFGLVRGGRPGPKPGMDDVTLARKVETEIFRGSSVKSTVNVNVVDGVVWLRGEVKRPEQIRRLEEKARAIPEVKGVENLVHLTKTPAPTRADTPRRQQRTRSSTRRPTPRREPAGRISDDRTDALTPEAEPSPAEHAAANEGRTPAPFGSTGGEMPEQSPEPGGGLGESSATGLGESSATQWPDEGITPTPGEAIEPTPDEAIEPTLGEATIPSPGEGVAPNPGEGYVPGEG
jgi:hypothetical protein